MAVARCKCETWNILKTACWTGPGTRWAVAASLAEQISMASKANAGAAGRNTSNFAEAVDRTSITVLFRQDSARTPSISAPRHREQRTEERRAPGNHTCRPACSICELDRWLKSKELSKRVCTSPRACQDKSGNSKETSPHGWNRTRQADHERHAANAFCEMHLASTGLGSNVRLKRSSERTTVLLLFLQALSKGQPNV